jgi:glycosyltransferase involved in cell wall biosynthesis
MTLRVAMVGLRAPWGADGGVEQSIAQLAPRLVQRGCAVTVYCRRRYNALGPGMHHGVRLVDTDTHYGKHTEAFVHSALATPRAALTHDLVHIHAMGPALFSWLPRMAGRATVVTVHGMDFERDKWGRVARGALRAGAWCAATFPHRTIVVGAHLADAFHQRWGRDTTLVPNAGAELSHAPLSAADVPGLEAGRYLLYLGRIVPEKGLGRLLDAYGRSAVELPLVITGSAVHASGTLARLQAAAPPGVRFTGPRRGVARDALVRHARAFVNPSRLEGLPLAPLEAMGAGVPVLLSDIPPHREILPDELDGVGGWRVADPDWADALRRVAAAPDDLLQMMGSMAQEHVAARFSWDAAADRTLAVYEQAVAAARGAQSTGRA